ncbi:hypothetical protein DFH11DRAFT_473 [Phellopilus nigrolimitatus]|nr:hypothetical protein DFH11DRAFT_473 [Phellopilus nigrolimitatus]
MVTKPQTPPQQTAPAANGSSTANGNSSSPDSSTSSLPSLEDLIVKYGDSSNTTWVEEKFDVWRHPPTGAAVGYAFASDAGHDYCIIWGNPLCAPEQLPAVVDAFLTWVDQQRRSPVWVCVDRAVEQLLAEERGWRAVMCIQEDALDPARAQPEKNKEVRKHIRGAERAGCHIVAESGEPPDDVKRDIDALVADWKANRKGTQVHTTNVEPWRDFEHRRFFYARDKSNKIVGFLFISKVSEGWAIKDCLQSRSSPKNLTEWLIVTAIHSLSDEGERRLTFGPTPAPTLDAPENAKVSSNSIKFLSKTYGGIQKALLGNKREFRRKFEVDGEPIFVCYPPHGFGKHGISALMDVLTD